MPIISAIGLFCYDKFVETPNEKVVNMSKLAKPYFSQNRNLGKNTYKNHTLDNKNNFLDHNKLIGSEKQSP